MWVLTGLEDAAREVGTASLPHRATTVAKRKEKGSFYCFGHAPPTAFTTTKQKSSDFASMSFGHPNGSYIFPRSFDSFIVEQFAGELVAVAESYDWRGMQHNHPVRPKARYVYATLCPSYITLQNDGQSGAAVHADR